MYVNREEVSKVILAELKFLEDNNVRTFQELADVVVCLRTHVDQMFNCFTTTTEEHTLNLVRRCAAHTYAHFVHTGEAVVVRPHDPVRTLGWGLINLDKAVQEAQIAIGREARGDARSHLMNILGVLTGILCQFGAPRRPGT